MKAYMLVIFWTTSACVGLLAALAVSKLQVGSPFVAVVLGFLTLVLTGLVGLEYDMLCDERAS